MRVYWFEEPVVVEDLDGYLQVKQALAIPTAGGGRSIRGTAFGS